MSKDFEKFAKDAFNNHEVKVDLDSVWENVEPHVKPKKDRKGILWFLLGGLTTGLIFTVLLFIQPNENTNLAKNNGVSEVETNLLKAEPPNAILKNNSPDERIKDKEYNKKNTKTTTAGKQPLFKNKAINYFKNNENNNNVNSEITKDDESLVFNESDLKNHLIKSVDEIDHNTTANLVDNTLKSRIVVINPLEFNLLNSPGFIVEEKVNPKDFDFSEKTLLPLTKPKMTFGVALYGGIGRPVSTRVAVDSLDREYDNARRNSEQQLELLQLGIGFLMKTKQNLTLRTGLEYNRLASRFNSESTTSIFDTIPNAIVEIIINPFTNDTTFIPGLAVNSIKTTRLKETYNYFHLIDVPLLVGYQMNYEKWSFGLEAGIIANLSVRSKGTILKPDGNFYDLKEDSEEWFKTNLGISPLIHLNLNYRIFDRFQVYTSPFFRFKSVYSMGRNPLKESYSTFGLQTGVKYSF